MLHLRLVFLQVRQSLLKSHVLLTLCDDGGVVGLGSQLEAGQDVRHVVRVDLLELVAHSFDLSSVHLNLLFVLLELVM